MQDRDADRRFLDALLEHHFHGDERADRERIESALRSIDGTERLDEPESGVVLRSPWSRALRWSAAAALVASLLLMPVLLTTTASAAMERVRVVMSRMVDFHYQLEVETPFGGEVSGELWARGGELVVIRQDRALGEGWVGEGRDSAWVVPPLSRLPVVVAEKGTLLEMLTKEEDLGLPFLRITTLLDRLGESFELEFGPDRSTIEARRLPGVRDDLPTQVSVRIAPDGVVRELTGQWNRGPGVLRAKLTWIDGEPKPASFYEHAAHHDAGRLIIDRR